MSNPLFVKVKEIVTQWMEENKESFKSKNIAIEIVKNTEECLYVILNLEECMAAIVVAEADFAPYRFVSFEAGNLVNGNYQVVYTWYDEEGTTIEEVIKCLNNAMDIFLEYNSRNLQQDGKCK
jgi:hypothetical protein